MTCTVFFDELDLVSVSMDSCNLFNQAGARKNMSSTVSRSTVSQYPLHEQDSANPYHILQIRRDATPSEIRESYRRLALWHHPGRSSTPEERERRAHVFTVLAACYETLIDNDARNRLDVLLNKSETFTLPAGQIHVGGKRVEAVGSSTRGKAKSGCGGLLDALFVNTATKSPCSSPKNELIYNDVDSAAPALANNSSETTDEDDFHFTLTNTETMMGGPLSQMYRARHFEEFSDPMIVFENVFGSNIFPSATTVPSTESRLPIRCPSESAAWTGSTTRLDGAIVSTTSRVLFDRKLTRTETISLDPKTKKRYKHVTVTSEQLVPTQESPTRENTATWSLCCVGQEKVVEDEIKSEGRNSLLSYVESSSTASFEGEDFMSQVLDVVHCAGSLCPV